MVMLALIVVKKAVGLKRKSNSSTLFTLASYSLLNYIFDTIIQVPPPTGVMKQETEPRGIKRSSSPPCSQAPFTRPRSTPQKGTTAHTPPTRSPSHPEVN